jgi:Tfp pilus assembly protein PilF
VLSAGNRYGPALESWRLALQWPAAPPGWWYGAGLCAAFAGDMASTRAYARTAYERLPSFPAAGVLWARAEWSIGDRDSCERLAQLLVRRGGLTPDQLGTLAALRAAR